MSKKSAAGSGKGKKAKGASAEPEATVSQPNVVDNGTNEAVESNAADTGSASGESESGNHAAQNVPVKSAKGRNIMSIELIKSNKARKGDRLVIFNLDGRRGSVQFQRSLFGDAVPDSLTLSGEFAEPKAPKAKETAEERKARLAALPKLTLAEKVARAEEKTRKLREKLQAAEAKEAVTAKEVVTA